MQLFAMFYLPQALKDDWGTQAESLAWVDMALFVGVALGAFIGGECSDRFGRKPTVLWSALFATLIGFYNAYVNSIEELAIMRFLLGITLGSFAPASTSITLETCPQDLRGKFGMAIPGFSGVAGKVAVALIADALYDDDYNPNYARFTWRAVLVLCTFPTFLGLAIGVYVLPESPRWLLAVAKQPQDAATALENLALKNSVPEAFPRGTRLAPAAPEESAEGFLSLQKIMQQPLLNETLLASLGMTAVSLVYYSLIYILPVYLRPFALENGWSIHSENMALVIVALSELPAVALMMYTVDCEELGRKRSVAAAAAATGLCCLILNFRFLVGLAHSSYGIVGSNFLARCAAAATVVSGNLYVAEIFPTGTRATAVSIAVTAGRIGAAASAPLAGFLLLDFHVELQLGMWEMLHPLRIHMFLGIVAFLAAICFMTMHMEPAGVPLPNTADERGTGGGATLEGASPAPRETEPLLPRSSSPPIMTVV